MPFIDWFEAARIAAVGRVLDRSAAKRSRRVSHITEPLEQRTLFSIVAALPLATPPIGILEPVALTGNHPNTLTPNTAGPFRPSDIRKAYGIDQISYAGVAGSGAGQTIAIIDAYNNPNIVSDVSTFNSAFGLPQFNGAGNPTFSVLNEYGQSTSLPANASPSTGAWDSEEALDVEWAHAIAPQANIVLFEANSAGDADLYSAVSTAANYAGVSVVSMSFGSTEFGVEYAYDSYFTTPSGHQGVTFLASTGDNDAPGEYPAYSPNVVAVGGTSLTLNSDSSYASESAWGNVNTGTGAGGGVSKYESQPSYQMGNVNGLGGTPAHRTSPDVSMLSDFSTGVYLYSTWNEGANNGGYYEAGGTSLAAPMWGGLVAIANQERVTAGMTTLDGPSQTLPRIYQLPSSDFHDVTTGNNGFAAGSGYDLATGLGTPIANLLVPQLAGINATASKLAFIVSPSNSTAGASIGPSITVAIEDGSGNPVTGDSSSVTISIAANPGAGVLSGTMTVSAVNGLATFSNLSINKAAAGYTLSVSDGALTGATSASFSISAAGASQVVFTQAPGNSAVESAQNPAVTASIEDAFGNLITTDSSTVVLTLNTGVFSTGLNTSSAAAVNGVATFGNLTINVAGSYSITASDGSLASATSGNFSVGRATPIVSVTDAGGTYNGTSFGATDASATDPNTSSLLASFGSGSLLYVYYAGTLTTGPQIAAASPLGGAPAAAGAYTVVAAYVGSSNYGPASSAPVNFSIAPRMLHVSASAWSKIYDGTTNATVTLVDDRIAGDILTLGYASAQFASRNVDSAIVVNIPGITLGGAAAGDYTLANTTASTGAAITPRTVTARITVASRTYDGTNQATITAESLQGAVAGDDVRLVGGTATFSGADVTATVVNVTGLSLAGADSGNYLLASSTATTSANITPRLLIGSVLAASKTYDGTTAASIAGRSLGGVLPNDSVSLVGGTASFTSNNIGNGKMVTVSGLAVTGTQADDYVLANPSESTTASILPMAISGTIFNDANMNGVMDAGELGIGGRTVDLLIAGKGTKGEKVVKTDGQGNFSFENVTAGSYIVKVVGTPGWHFTTIGTAGAPLSLSLGTDISGLQLGETNASTVAGGVFLSANGGIRRKSVTSGFAGWTIELDGVSNGVHLTATTDSSGAYTFNAVPVGAYRITIVQQAGYTIINKARASLSIALNGSKTLSNENFGEQPITASARRKR